MYIKSDSILSFYSTYYNQELDNKPIDHLVNQYKKYSKLSAKFEDLPEDNPIKVNCYTSFGEKLVAQRSTYYSAILNRCIGMVLNIGKSLYSGSITEQDLFSYGEEILLNCLDKWEPSKGTKFTTYFSTSVTNMIFTLKNKKHFRDWNRSIRSLDGMVDEEGSSFSPSEEDALKWGGAKKRIRVNKDTLNDELNKLIFNPGMAELLKYKLGMTDDLVIHYMLLCTKKQRAIINSNELEVLKYLKKKFIKEHNKDFSIIYMYDSNYGVDEYDENTENKNKTKEEILCQE